MLFRGQPRPFQSIYPILISPAWLADAVPTSYSIVKGMNAVMMSLAAVPFWLWARRLMPRPHAVAALVLFLLLPAFLYTNQVMTENAAFPAILLAMFTAALALERPTALRQLLAVAAIGLACATRLQALVLFLAFPSAIALKAFLDAQATQSPLSWGLLSSTVRRFAWALGVILVGGALYLAVKVAQGAALTAVLGTYEGTQSGYSIESVTRWLVFHVAELPYAVGLVPVSAFIVLVGLAVRRGAKTSEAERALLAVGLGASLWMILQVAAFASQFSQRVEERNMIYLTPLFLLAFLLWIAKGLPRPPLLTAAAAFVPAVLLVSLPLESLLNVSATSDTFALVPLMRLSTMLDGGTYDVRILLALGAVAAALAFLVLPKRYATWLLPAGIAVLFALTSYSVFGSSRVQGGATRAAPGVLDVNWIDDLLGSGSEVVFVNDQGLDGDPHTLWQTEFWNRSVHPVLNLAPPFDVLGQTATLDQETGRITALDPDVQEDASDAKFAVAPSTLHLAGREVSPAGKLILYRVEQPLRLAQTTSGIYSDGWTSDRASLTQYATPEGRSTLRITLERPKVGAPIGPAQVRIRIGSLEADQGVHSIGRLLKSAAVTVPLGRKRVVELPVPKRFQLELGVTPTFSPAALGVSADSRALGVHALFELVRR
jgi:hypothetical protein